MVVICLFSEQDLSIGTAHLDDHEFPEAVQVCLVVLKKKRSDPIVGA